MDEKIILNKKQLIFAFALKDWSSWNQFSNLNQTHLLSNYQNLPNIIILQNLDDFYYLIILWLYKSIVWNNSHIVKVTSIP